jgi:hypothetical protein
MEGVVVLLYSLLDSYIYLIIFIFINLLQYLSDYKKCYVCDNDTSTIVNGKDVEDSDSFYFNFSLITKFNTKYVSDYSCRIKIDNAGNFNVDFFKNKKIIDYVPINVYEIYLLTISRKKLNIFKFCHSCGNYSCKSSELELNHHNNTWGGLRLREEWIYMVNDSFDMSISNNYEDETSLLSVYEKSSIEEKTSKIKKSAECQIINKNLSYKEYNDKIKKYLMLI